MRDLPSQKMSSKISPLFLVVTLLFILQAVSFGIVNAEIGQINHKLIFGLVGDNVLALSILVIFLFPIAWLRHIGFIGNLPFGLIFAGVGSNILDRLIWGGAVDYLPLLNLTLFNLADLVIIFGVAAFYICKLRRV